MLDKEFTPPEGLPDYAAELLQDHDVLLPRLAQELTVINAAAVHADDQLLDVAGGSGPGSQDPDDRALAALTDWRADVDSEPLPPIDDDDILALAEAAGLVGQRYRAARLAARILTAVQYQRNGGAR